MSAPFIEAAVKTSVVLIAAAAINVLLYRRTSAASRHLVWTLAVAGLLLLPLLSAALPRWRVTIHVAAPDARTMVPLIERTGHVQAFDSVPAGTGVASSIAPTAILAALSTPIAGHVGWPMVLSALYLVGSSLLLIRLAADRWTIHRLARHAIRMSDPEWTALLVECLQRINVRRPVRLLRSLERTMPMAFGIWRPAILMPSVADTWSEDRRRAVLLHELAHIARHDCFTQLMAVVACAVYWIHPGVWWVAKRLRVERELACDDCVLAVGTHAREYAEHLLELAYTFSSYQAPALVVSMARPRQVEGRMLAVLDDTRHRTAPTPRSRLSAVAIAAALLVPVAAAEATAVPARQKPETPEVAPADVVAQPRLPGTWAIGPSENARVVHLRLAESVDSSSGFAIAIERLEGFSSAWLSGAGGPGTFAIRRDAGVLAFEGTFRSSVGAGTYTFTPSASFPAELAKRGFTRPTPADQYRLARGDIGFAFLDELTAQGYARPDLAQLVRTAQHGVDLDYLREMGRSGYRLGQVEALITQKDHGVSPPFIRELAARGLTGLTAGDLVRARDHGISPGYIGELQKLEYTGLSLEALVSARDHGISPDYVRDLRRLGYRLTLAELTAARDHGVSSEYIRELAALGYQRLSLDDLIGGRDHGISPEYVRDLRQLGYRLTLAELTAARDHGISGEYIRGLTALGYQRLSLGDLVRLRDHGVSPEYVRQLNDQGRNGLTVDELVATRNGRDLHRDLHAVNFRVMLRTFFDRWMR
jgi:beta-lactamase regulating signal transducer with metallopeptidase domain